MKIWGFFLLLTCLAPLLVKADEARLRIAIEGGAFNAKFKFFDASAGCPGYNDIPGARDYLGGVFASSKGSTKVLPTDTPVHVFLFSPRDTPGISAGGGQPEIRRRALQVTLDGDAELVITGFNDHVPEWRSSGDIEVAPASACEQTAAEEDAGDDLVAEQHLGEQGAEPPPVDREAVAVFQEQLRRQKLGRAHDLSLIHI